MCNVMERLPSRDRITRVILPFIEKFNPPFSSGRVCSLSRDQLISLPILVLNFSTAHRVSTSARSRLLPGSSCLCQVTCSRFWTTEMEDKILPRVFEPTNSTHTTVDIPLRSWGRGGIYAYSILGELFHAHSGELVAENYFGSHFLVLMAKAIALQLCRAMLR